MKKNFLKAAVMTLVAGGAIFGTAMVSDAANVRILPVDTAKFWAGARFDFDVEVSGAKNPENVKVDINGVPADKFFGKNAVQKTLDNGVVSYRIDQVSFPKTGDITVTASANDNGVVSTSTAKYKVVNEKAVKRAKNVILFIGDGMSLQAREIARILSKGMTNGKYNDLLAMEKLDHNAVITTSGYDSLVTDSANSASAYATGHKSVVNAMGVYEDSTKDPLDDPKVENLSEILKRTRGMSIGIITQAESTDATLWSDIPEEEQTRISWLRATSTTTIVRMSSWAAALPATSRPPYRDPREKTMTTSSRTSRTRATPSFPIPRK